MNLPSPLSDLPPVAIGEPKSRTKILLIEDEAYLRKFLRLALERAGYAVTEAADGREGLRQYDAVRPDGVITDLKMPEKDGLEFITEMRRHQHRVPLVAISGGVDGYTPIGLKTARLLGADATLHKPFSASEMTEVLTRLLRPEPSSAN